MTHSHLPRRIVTMLAATALLAACSQPAAPDAPASAPPASGTPAAAPATAPASPTPVTATPPPAPLANTPAATDPAVPPTSCDASRAQWAIGQTLDEALLERARVDAGASVVRSLKPDQVVTMEFNGERLNVDVDAADNVTGVRCG